MNLRPLRRASGPVAALALAASFGVAVPAGAAPGDTSVVASYQDQIKNDGTTVF